MTEGPVRAPGFAATVSIVAAKEFRDCLYGRWLVSGTVLFALLAAASFFGTAALGGSISWQPLATVMNSVASLTTFMLPLLAILVSYDAFAGEAESGTLLLMLTYPVDRMAWLAGKAAGKGLALFLVLAAGAAFLALAHLFADTPYPVSALAAPLIKLAASGWLLALAFMSAGFWVSLAARQKSRALALLFALWFALVLVYDLGLLVASVALAGMLSRDVLALSLLASPASVFRLINQGGAAVPEPVLWAVLAVWAALPAAGAAACLKRYRP